MSGIKDFSTTVRQRGVALITAMLVVSLATLTAVSLASRQTLDVRRTSNIIEIDQAYLYTLGLETVAKAILQKYTEKFKYDDPTQIVPFAFPVENGVVSGQIFDLEARFNINNLLDKDGQKVEIEAERLRRLIEIIARRLGVTDVSPDSMVMAVLDWLDKDQEPQLPGGAEDGEYMSKEYPYRAANRMMVSTSELFLVEGFSRELLSGKYVGEDEDAEFVPGLLSYVAALPDHGTAISINTVKDEVLMALSPHITESNVAGLLTGRPFKDVNDFRNQDGIKDISDNISDAQEKERVKKELEEDLKGLDVQSSYLLIDGNATVGRSRMKLNSIIYRTSDARVMLTFYRAQGTDDFRTANEKQSTAVP